MNIRIEPGAGGGESASRSGYGTLTFPRSKIRSAGSAIYSS